MFVERSKIQLLILGQELLGIIRRVFDVNVFVFLDVDFSLCDNVGQRRVIDVVEIYIGYFFKNMFRIYNRRKKL